MFLQQEVEIHVQYICLSCHEQIWHEVRLRSRRPFVPGARNLLDNLARLGIRASEWTNHKWNAEYCESASRLRAFVPGTSVRPVGMGLPRAAVEDFKSALTEIKDKCTSKGILNPIFIADNARIYHYSGVKELIASLQLKVVYLPPYLPFLNLIKNIFSVCKNLVIRGEAKSENELKELIVSKFGKITRELTEDVGLYMHVRKKRNYQGMNLKDLVYSYFL